MLDQFRPPVTMTSLGAFRPYEALRHAAYAFVRARDGNIAIIFGLVLLPVVSLAGAAVGYGRAGQIKAGLQTALDAALVAGARDGTTQWADTAPFDVNVFTRESGRLPDVEPEASDPS